MDQPETAPAPHAPAHHAPPHAARSAFERLVEGALWQVRWVMFLPVVALLASAVHFSYKAAFHVYEAFEAASGTESLILHIEAMDASLLAAAEIIFALGLYELFISKINVEGAEAARSVLVIHSLDDLKSKLGKIIIMLLVVRFFKLVQSFVPHTSPEVLAFAGGVVGMAVTLYLVKARHE